MGFWPAATASGQIVIRSCDAKRYGFDVTYTVDKRLIVV
jgi:hypothetical protein